MLDRMSKAVVRDLFLFLESVLSESRGLALLSVGWAASQSEGSTVKLGLVRRFLWRDSGADFNTDIVMSIRRVCCAASRCLCCQLHS